MGAHVIVLEVDPLRLGQDVAECLHAVRDWDNPLVHVTNTYRQKRADPARWRDLLGLFLAMTVGFTISLLVIVLAASWVYYLIYPFLFWVTPPAVFGTPMMIIPMPPLPEIVKRRSTRRCFSSRVVRRVDMTRTSIFRSTSRSSTCLP